eukprot:jgi/Tetstr1/436521/TSEL_025347.t1
MADLSDPLQLAHVTIYLSDPAILAQLRDKHPSRSHPIPDTVYDIPVDEAALTVDMCVPYQQLEQHVAAVGEAERRAAEWAVVDNMKEAYVSVLAASISARRWHISAGDSMLIHGVRLIAEKLGAVIVHTDLRNAYNEAWRRTIIQRHIDCSPLHPVIHALLASRTEEAFAKAVDATVLAAVERVLRVSFDSSTYGTDTNPVVTDFLAELLHDPDL